MKRYPQPTLYFLFTPSPYFIARVRPEPHDLSAPGSTRLRCSGPQPQRALVFTDSVSEPVAVVRPVVSPQSTASPPQWLDPTLRRIQELLTLGRDWDRRGSAAVRTYVLAFAYSMLSQVMGPTTLAPSIVPLGQGGIQLLWATPSVEVEVEVPQPNEIIVYQVDRATGHESEWQATTEFSSLGDVLRSAFTR